MKLHLYESTVPQWADDLGQQVYNALTDAGLYSDVNVEPGNTEHDCTISVEVMNGDWKHEHLRTDNVVTDLLDNPGVTYGRKIKETPVDDSDSDTYSSIHTYAVIKLHPSTVESLRKKNLMENNETDFEYIKSKDVLDSDGFYTEYTMYKALEDPEYYVFVFGDRDFYDPNEDHFYEFDYECDTREEAEEWFANYKGFENTLDESYTESL